MKSNVATDEIEPTSNQFGEIPILDELDDVLDTEFVKNFQLDTFGLDEYINYDY